MLKFSMLQRQQDLQTDIAERILFLLEKREMTQQQFADTLGKNKSHVSRIIHGKMNLTVRLISEMEKVLDAAIVNVDKS
jgi:transcriptional regulator with XRE-family HTH domain